MSASCSLPVRVLTAGDLVASDQFRGRRFRLLGGGLDFDSAVPGVGAAAGLIRIERAEKGQRNLMPRWVHPSQPVYLVRSHG